MRSWRGWVLTAPRWGEVDAGRPQPSVRRPCTSVLKPSEAAPRLASSSPLRTGPWNPSRPSLEGAAGHPLPRCPGPLRRRRLPERRVSPPRSPAAAPRLRGLAGFNRRAGRTKKRPAGLAPRRSVAARRRAPFPRPGCPQAAEDGRASASAGGLPSSSQQLCSFTASPPGLKKPRKPPYSSWPHSALGHPAASGAARDPGRVGETTFQGADPPRQQPAPTPAPGSNDPRPRAFRKPRRLAGAR